jgi:hypothetical protein
MNARECNERPQKIEGAGQVNKREKAAAEFVICGNETEVLKFAEPIFDFVRRQ